MAEYLEKSAVVKAIHNEVYSGGKWSGGWYEKSEEQAEKDFIKRINTITPEKVIDISVIEDIQKEIRKLSNKMLNGEYIVDRKEVLEIIDRKVKEIEHD